MGAAAVLETAADTPPTIIRLQSAGHLFHRCNSRSISALAATIPLLQFGENCISLGELRYVLKKSTTNPCYHSFMLASRFWCNGELFDLAPSPVPSLASIHHDEDIEVPLIEM